MRFTLVHLALGMVHIDVQNKEQVIAQGQKIYVPLAPRDPRSLMQGDYMALNFAFPQEVRDALNKGDTLGTSRHALVVAVLDERGVATVRRLAQSNEALSAGERLLPQGWRPHRWSARLLANCPIHN